MIQREQAPRSIISRVTPDLRAVGRGGNTSETGYDIRTRAKKLIEGINAALGRGERVIGKNYPTPHRQSVEGSDSSGSFSPKNERPSRKDITLSAPTHNLSHENGQIPEGFDVEQEYRNTWTIRPILKEDTKAMIDQDWFVDPRRTAHIKGDFMEGKTFPDRWGEEDKKKFKKEVLDPFYFSGPFTVRATDDKGNLIREVENVSRETTVLLKNEVVSAAISHLTNDPWAPETDLKRFKMAHAQFLVVDPERTGEGLALLAEIVQARKLFSKGYDQIIAWVNLIGNYSINETLLKSVGYEEDRRQKGRIVLNPTTSERIEMRRYILTANNWRRYEASAVSRWEQKKRGFNLREPNLG